MEDATSKRAVMPLIGEEPRLSICSEITARLAATEPTVTPDRAPLLHLKNLTAAFSRGDGHELAVDDLSFATARSILESGSADGDDLGRFTARRTNSPPGNQRRASSHLGHARTGASRPVPSFRRQPDGSSGAPGYTVFKLDTPNAARIHSAMIFWPGLPPEVGFRRLSVRPA